jgi:hypothetical protein
MHAVEHRPAHAEDAALLRFEQQGRGGRVAHEFERRDGKRSSTMPMAAFSFSRVGLRPVFDCSMSRSAILSIPATIVAEKSGFG